MSVLVGLGVGPGDPDYVTVKGVKAIKVADVIFVPVGNNGEPGYAEQVVAHYAPRNNIVRLPFELGNWSDNYDERLSAWDDAAKPVVDALNEGKYCLFATIGDPNVFATFTYLARAVRRARPETEIETIPGIMAMQALASASKTVICEDTQTVALMPLTLGMPAYIEALETHDTVVAYKGGRKISEIRAAIDQAGRSNDVVFGAKLGHGDQVVLDHLPESAPYLSTVIVSRGRLTPDGHPARTGA